MTKANGVKRRKKKLDLAEKRRKAMVETEGGMVLEAGTRVQRRLAALELVAPRMTVCSPAVNANKWPRDAISNQFRLAHCHQVFERHPLFRDCPQKYSGFRLSLMIAHEALTYPAAKIHACHPCLGD